MKPFRHINATTIDGAASLLAEYKGKAKLMAGGTDLLGELKDRILPGYPDALINIKTVPGMEYIREEEGVLKIGALTKLQDIANSGVVKGNYALLAQAAHSVSSPHIRRMGTIGGNLCQDVRCWYFRASALVGDPFYCLKKGGKTCFAVAGDNRYHAILGGKGCFAVCPSDTAMALTALNATIVTNKRSIPITDFFKVLRNALGADEIVTEVQVPKPKPGTKQLFTKFGLRKALDFAVVSVATAISVEAGKVAEARIVLGGVSPIPFRAIEAESAIEGKVLSEATAEAAGAAAVKNATPLSNNAYKIQIAKTLVKRAILS